MQPSCKTLQWVARKIPGVPKKWPATVYHHDFRNDDKMLLQSFLWDILYLTDTQTKDVAQSGTHLDDWSHTRSQHQDAQTLTTVASYSKQPPATKPYCFVCLTQAERSHQPHRSFVSHAWNTNPTSDCLHFFVRCLLLSCHFKHDSHSIWHSWLWRCHISKTFRRRRKAFAITLLTSTQFKFITTLWSRDQILK